MSEHSIGAVGAATGVEGVAPPVAGQRTAWTAPPGDAQPSEPAVPGVTEFDRLELTGSGALQQAYAKFTVDQRTGVTTIKIIDAQTDRVIREIPSEQVLKIVEELQKYIAARQARGG